VLAEGGTLCYTQLMQPEELLFKEAMEAIDKKEIAKAREIMTRLLQRNRSNADYWVWMSALVETVKEREFCLREARKINPVHPMVIQGLRWLGEPIEDSNPLPPVDAEKLKWKTTLEAEVQPSRPASRPKTRLSSWIALGVTVTVLVVALIFIARSQRFRPDTSPILRFSLTPPPTATSESTPTAEITGQLPLWAALKATYTATPIYAATPHKLTEAYQAAMKAYSRQDWSAALEYFQQVLYTEPASADIQYHIGEIYRFQGLLSEATTAYDDCIRINPAFAPPYLGKGRVLMMSNPPDPVKAQKQFEKAIELDPRLYEALEELAQISLDAGKPEEALASLKKMPPDAPLTPRTELIRAQAYLLMNDPIQALAAAQKANQIDVTYLPVYKLMAEIYLAQDSTQDALPPLETYLIYQPEDTEALAMMSTVQVNEGDYEAALEYAEQALALNPRSIPAQLARGEVYLQQGKLDEAALDFNAVLRQEKKSFGANLGIGRIQIERKLYGSAFEFCRAAYDLATSDRQKALALYWRAQALIGLDQKNAAANDLNALLAFPPGTLPAEIVSAAAELYRQVITPTPTPTRTLTPAPSATLTSSGTPSTDQTLTPGVGMTTTPSPTPPRK